MLESIKKIEGINHNEFDDLIVNYIEAAKIDLKNIGIVDKFLIEPNSLIKSLIITFVLSFLDTENSELYQASYSLQKDTLRRTSEYVFKKSGNGD